MGLREGEFPRSKNENWIYNDRERAELSGVGVELDNTACAYAEDKFFFCRSGSNGNRNSDFELVQRRYSWRFRIY